MTFKNILGWVGIAVFLLLLFSLSYVEESSCTTTFTNDTAEFITDAALSLAVIIYGAAMAFLITSSD